VVKGTRFEGADVGFVILVVEGSASHYGGELES
jgi:hypothetical protein